MKATTEVNNLQKTFDLCLQKTRGNIKLLADNPKSWAWSENGNYSDFHEGFFDIGNWTSSFHTGMALLAYRQTKDGYFLEQLERLAGVYHEKVFVQYMENKSLLKGFIFLNSMLSLLVLRVNEGSSLLYHQVSV